MSREAALSQWVEIQERLMKHLRTFDEGRYSWTLVGGSTEDDGAELRVTLELVRRYAPDDNARGE